MAKHKNIESLTVLRGSGRLETIKSTSYTGGTSYDAFMAQMGRVISADDSGLALAYAATVQGYRCVNIRASKFSSIPYNVIDKRTGKLVPQHPLTEAINDAYRWRKRDLMFDVEAAVCVWGELYIERMRNVFGMPAGLKWINPLVIEPYIVRGEITYFQVSDMFSGKSYRLDTDAVAYYRTFNPMDDNRGLPAMAVALDAINVKRSIQKSTKAWFENDSRPDYIVSPKAGDGWGSDVLDRITEWWKTNLKGQKNRGKGAIIDMPIDYNQLQREPVPEQVDLSKEQRSEICSAFGVPLSLAGTWEDATYDSGDDQRQSLYEETLIPEAQTLDKFITAEWLPFFDDSGHTEFKHDFTQIMAMAGNTQKRIAAVSQKYRDGAITMNEYRLQTGDKAVQGGDIYLIPSGAIVVSVTDLPNAAQLINIAPPPAMPMVAEPQSIPATTGADTTTQTDVIPAQIMEPTKAYADLAKWERSTLRNGRTKALRFATDNVPQHIKSYVLTALNGIDCDDKQAVRGVFTKATAMLSIGEDSIEQLQLSTVNHAPDISYDEVMAARGYLEMIGAIEPIAVSVKATFDESKHPRADDGKFGHGSGSSGSSSEGDSGGSSTPKQSSYDKPFSEAHSEKLSKGAVSKLSTPQKKAIEGYSGADARIINDNLRGKESFRVLNDNDHKQIAVMDSAIASHELPEDTALYRGFTLSPRGISKVKVGQTITDKSFVSTSLNPDVAHSYSGAKKGVKGSVIMKVNAPKGTKGLPMSTLSEWPGEHEVLLPRGTTFKITSMRKEKGVTYVDAEIS